MHLAILTFSLTLTLLWIVRPIPLMVNNQSAEEIKINDYQILNFHEDGDDDDDDDDDENEIWEDVSDNGFAE